MSRIRQSATVNGVESLVDVRHAAASDVPPGSNSTVAIVRRVGQHSGLAHVAANDAEHRFATAVPAISVDELLGPSERALLLKIDVEGHEPAVLASARRALSEERIDNIVLEFYARRFGSVERGVALLDSLFGFNLTVCVLVHSQGASDAWVGRFNHSSFDTLPERRVLRPHTAREWVQDMFERNQGKDIWAYRAGWL